MVKAMAALSTPIFEGNFLRTESKSFLSVGDRPFMAVKKADMNSGELLLKQCSISSLKTARQSPRSQERKFDRRQDAAASGNSSRTRKISSQKATASETDRQL
jgi:hypothetical protein